jgi:general secretion pathway protein L
MFERTILGLDLGSYAVKAAELQAGLRGVEFTRLESMVLPSYASPEEREATIQLFLEQRGLSREHVITAIGADRGTQRHLRFPFSGRRIAQAVLFEIADQLPLPLDTMIVVHESVPASPEQTDVLAILTPRTEIELHLESMHRMETEPRTIEVEGAVLANLSHYLHLADVGRLVIDIGHRKTTICLLVDGRPAVLRTVPIAGHHLTQAMARDRKIAYDVAEEDKHARGLFEPMSAKPVTQGVARLLDQLAREAMRSIQAVVSDPLDPIAPAEVVLCGGTALAPGLADYMSERTGMRCRKLEVPTDAEVSEVFAEADPAVYAHASALALRGAPTERVTQIDLRQDEFEYVPDLSGLRGQLQLTVGLFGLLLTIWIASLGIQLWGAESRADNLRDELARIYQQTFPDETTPPDPADTLATRLRESRELANHLGVTGSGISVLEVMRLISERIPQNLDVSLSDLRLERHSVRARGYSQDFVTVDKVRAELEKVDWFEEVVLSDVVNEPRRGGKSFSLTIKFAEAAE